MVFNGRFQQVLMNAVAPTQVVLYQVAANTANAAMACWPTVENVDNGV